MAYREYPSPPFPMSDHVAADTSVDAVAKSEELKGAGNEAFVAKDFAKALTLYNEAIELVATNHVLYSNRSAARLKVGDAEGSLADATESVRLNPSWSKGFVRQAQALVELGRLEDALAPLTAAKRLEPTSKHVQAQYDDVIAQVRAADRTVPITSVDHWNKLYARIGDSFIRLGCIATFWNLATPADRLQIMNRFMAHVFQSADGMSGADFDESAMIELPMHNYAGLELPETWQSFFSSQPVKSKVAMYIALWDNSSLDEKDRIMADVGHFFAPKIGGAFGAAAAGIGGSRAHGLVEEFEDDSDDEGVEESKAPSVPL